MISIIICSRSARMLQTVSENVAATIGVPYEVIGIDNSQNRYGICEAYNVGAAQSRYPILCFMHEDLHVHTANWGQRVQQILQDETIGVLGVAGSQYVPQVPCPWWESGEKNLRVHVMHTADTLHQEVSRKNYPGHDLADVAVVDGLWMCTRRDVWQQHPFDQTTFPEFHYYDVDFCTEIYLHYRVCVTYGILIEHFSQGSLNSSWTRNALRYQQKRARQLPLGQSSYSKAETRAIEVGAAQLFIHRLLSEQADRSVRRAYLWRTFRLQPFNRDTLYLLRKGW